MRSSSKIRLPSVSVFATCRTFSAVSLRQVLAVYGGRLGQPRQGYAVRGTCFCKRTVLGSVAVVTDAHNQQLYNSHWRTYVLRLSVGCYRLGHRLPGTRLATMVECGRPARQPVCGLD